MKTFHSILILPFESVREMMVLFGETLTLKIGKSLNGIPLKSLLGVFIFGKVSFFLEWRVIVNKKLY